MQADARWLFCDLDGTLADSLGALRAAYESFLRSHGAQGNDEEFARLNGPSLREIVATLVAWHGLAIPIADAYAGYVNGLRSEYRERVLPFSGANELLEGLRHDGWNLALVTSAPRVVVTDFLDVRGWTRKFGIVVCGDEVDRGKPSPDLYLAALAKAGADPANCVVLEDSANGIASARAAGLLVLRVHASTLDPAVPSAANLMAAWAYLKERTKA